MKKVPKETESSHSMGGTNTSIALFAHIYKNTVVKLYVGEHVKETKTQCVRVQNQCKRIFSHERYEIGGGVGRKWSGNILQCTNLA